MVRPKEGSGFNPYYLPRLFPEAPKGDKLINETTKTVRKALVTCYPSLENIYRERMRANLHLYESSELREKIISEIPTQKTPAEEKLLKSGLLKTSIYQEQVKGINSLFLYHPDAADEISALDSLFKKFGLNDEEQRIKFAIDFGQSLILEIVRSLPIPQKLHGKDKAIFKERAIDHLSIFIETVKKRRNQPIDSKKLETLQEVTQSLTLESSKARFFACGAEVLVLLSGQKIMYPSYSVGELLNEGIVEILAEKAQLKFIDLMKQKFPTFNGYLKPHEAKNKDHAKKILEACGLGDLIQDEKSLFELYVSSQIPARMFNPSAQENLPM